MAGQPSSNKFTVPEDSANLWSWMTFSFVVPLFRVANSRTVNDEDVWTLSPYFMHKNIFTKYLQYISEWVSSNMTPTAKPDHPCSYPKHSLIRYLLVSNSLDLILDILLDTWSAVVGARILRLLPRNAPDNFRTGFVPPYALQRILIALSDPSPRAKDARNSAYFFATLAFLANLSFAQIDVNKGWYTRRCYERTRGQLFCALHYKCVCESRAVLTAHVNGTLQGSEAARR